MRIKRLDIAGFKSFVDATTITFPDSITAVVGPNGCGKSNVVDAIRWVMGEQSAKHLRGRAMEDVIFSGSETRGPAAFAEVSLTFDAQAMPGDAVAGGVAWGVAGPAEVKVTRRLFRDGLSEYLLNGVSCRLRDIVEFFLGTGVGSKAYAIIEQGRIGFIVSSKPEDRRGLIDEAAGITKYKAKKRLAERRMDGTRQHLLRVSDILGELESRLRSLRLQAQKAERYKRYKGELRDLELWASSQRFLGFLAEEKSLLAAAAETEELHRSEETRVLAEEAELEVERLTVAEEQSELAAAKDELFAISNRASLDQQRGQHHAAEAASLRERVAAATRESEDLQRRLEEGARRCEELEVELGGFAEEAELRRMAHEEKQRQCDELKQRLGASRSEVDAAAASGASVRARAARLEADMEAATARLEDLARRFEALQGEREGLDSGAALLEAEATELSLAIAVLEQRREERADRLSALDATVQDLSTQVARGELELETLREEGHRRRSRLQSLEEIQTRYESFQRGVRAIMKEAKSESEAGVGAATDSVPDAKPWAFDTAVRGLVADIVQPPPELEAAVEAVLGERLGNIIVESQEAGVDAIQFLKTRSEGRSSFIPMQLRPAAPAALDRSPAPAASSSQDSARGAPGGSAEVPVIFAAAPDAGAQGAGAGVALVDVIATSAVNSVPMGEGVRGSMLELIGYDRQYHHVAAFLLGDVVVVESLQQALELWRRTQTAKTIVTLEGEVIDPSGVVTGGSRESAVAGVLSQKREIRELEALVARIEADREAVMTRLISVKHARAEAMATRETLQREAREDDLAAVSQRKDLERVQRELRGQQERRARLDRAVEEVTASRGVAESRRQEAEAGLFEARELADGAEGRVIELRAATEALAGELDAEQAALLSLRLAMSQAEGRHVQAQSERERLAREREDHEVRRERLERGAVDEAARAAELEVEGERLREAAALARGEADARARVQSDREEAVEERVATLSRREADLRAARQEANRLAQELSSLQLRAREAELRRSSLEEHIADRYRDVTLSSVVYDYHLRAPVGDLEDERMTELRGLIERMGEINLTAIEESAELQKRFDFLTVQKADLESAVAQLEAAIEKINRASRKRFREVFDAVNAKFQEVFPRCFGGGRARLHLTDESDMLETGVEIIANPPGKKIAQNIELLSGGEKAMTAVALLFAIFLVKPSPFCLLDEVDAPLDEANVGRFNEMVRAMTDRSQFIIISHNRRTMEIADRLCGITMEEPGVSKLVAVNLRRASKSAGPSGPVAGDATSSGAFSVA
jgi:chromosome segregation protein